MRSTMKKRREGTAVCNTNAWGFWSFLANRQDAISTQAQMYAKMNFQPRYLHQRIYEGASVESVDSVFLLLACRCLASSPEKLGKDNFGES
jgi:hypothetical protein